MKLKSIIKNLLLAGIVTIVPVVSGLVAAQSANTGPNKVYIEQLGNTNKVIIDQIGGNNNVGGIIDTTPLAVDATGVTTLVPEAPSSTNYALINGSSNNVTMKQQGDSNSAQYNIKGSNNNYTSTIVGNVNQTKLIMGDTNTNTTNSNVTETVTGNNNLILQTVVGDAINSTVKLTGDRNQVTNELKSSNGTSYIEVTLGSDNVINAQQIDAAGANGHSLRNVITGSYNSITTQQQGTNDSTIDIKTTGDHNTITVRSTNAASVLNAATAIVR